MRLPFKLIGPVSIALLLAPPASAAPPPAMTVAVHPASGEASSYFTLSARPGRLVHAGTLELRNRGRRKVSVRLDPVGALTATTLGSAYRVATDAPTAQARWIELPTDRIVLGPHGRATVPVAVRTPDSVSAGDYLSGISVQAAGPGRETRMKGNIAISSVQRYAVGMFVKVPGPRNALIELPSARVEREPSGLTFYVQARNEGNTILQDVRGSVLVTRGRRTVARAAIGPGTFVSGTAIAYPLLAPHEQPREGAVYRVRAVMRYASGKVARLDTQVRFGHAAAKTQQDFGGPPAEEPGSDSLILLMVVAAFVLLGLIGALLLVRRRRTPGLAAARRAIERAVANARATRKPLSLVRIADSSGETGAGKLAAAVRGHIRRSDQLYRLGPAELVLVAPDTFADAARLVCSDFQLLLSKAAGPGRIDIRVVEAGRRSAEDLIARLQEPAAAQLDEYELDPRMTSSADGARH